MEATDVKMSVTASDAEGRRRIGPRAYRLLEIIPGGLVWTTLVLAVVLSFIAPLAVIYFIIIFDLYWLFRVCFFVFSLAVSWDRYRREGKIDWLARVKAIPRFDDIRHLIFMPTYKEDLAVLRTSFASLAASAYPMKERCIVVLAGEEGDRERFAAVADAIVKEFGDKFFRLLVTVHPRGLADEIPGKGSNLNWAGHRAQELIDELRVPYEHVIVSSFDIDTCVHPQYFARLTHAYLTHPTPLRTSYQPIALYNNNIWDAPAAVRIAAFGTTFWLMTELTRPERLFTFSSHSMPMRALVDVGFWQKDIVTEDSRIFLQCLLRYDGDYTVTPLSIPVSMDTVAGDTYWQSLRNLYKQQRRWAWGVEHLPYLVSRFVRNPSFPLRKKIFHLWTLGEGMYTWATAPLMITLLGYLPFWFAPDSLRAAVLFQNTPHTLALLMRLALVGVFVSAVMSFTLLPPMPQRKRPRAWLVMILQWMLVPVTFVLFGSLPAIDAQTRLMLGRYLGFNVTQKKRT